MEKKHTMAKAVLTFAISMAGTIAGNFIYHHFKSKRDEKLKQQELDEWSNTIPESIPDVHSAENDEILWKAIADTEAKTEEPKEQAEEIWQKLQKLDNKEIETITVSGADDTKLKKPEKKKSVKKSVSNGNTHSENTNGTLSEKEAFVLEMHEIFGGSLSTKQIMEQTGMGRSTIDKIKKRLIDAGYQPAEGKKLKKANSGIDWNQADKLIISGEKNDTEIAKLLQCDNSSISKRRKKLKASGRLSA